ncbi:hypothetical protein BH160DRAFT_6487 [Burkholderia sp. H160]|nr:hypothetical protein BH160DRAFT_6487 [Burkholderia sp. H160]
MARRKWFSESRPSITSSVITETCGSMTIANTTVAKPLITDERFAHVTRRSGFK